MLNEILVLVSGYVFSTFVIVFCWSEAHILVFFKLELRMKSWEDAVQRLFFLVT